MQIDRASPTPRTGEGTPRSALNAEPRGGNATDKLGKICDCGMLRNSIADRRHAKRDLGQRRGRLTSLTGGDHICPRGLVIKILILPEGVDR